MKKEHWLRLLMVLSGTACTALWMQTDRAVSFGITAVLSMVLMGVLCFKTSFLETLFAPRSRVLWVLAGILTLSSAYNAKSTLFRCTYRWMTMVLDRLELPLENLILRGMPWCVALAAMPMLLGYFLWFLERMRRLALRIWKETDFTEQIFLLGAGCVMAMLIAFTYLCTQGFYGAEAFGQWYGFDLIYSADSGYLVQQDVYRNVGAEQNDLRQPLFGLFAMPFAETAWLLSKVLFFLPNGYLMISQIMQMLLYLTALVLLSRMLELGKTEKLLFLLLMCVSYPVIIFVLTAEQYLFAVSWLLMLIYLREQPEEQAIAFTAATGALLTSGALFPLVTWDRDFKAFVKKSFMLCGVFFGAMVLCGRLTTFLDIPTYIAGYVPYTGVDVAPLEKLRQYVNFVGACVVCPPSGVDFTTYSHVSWQMLPVTGWNPVGLLVLAASVCGILLGWKRRIVKISAVWIGYSLLMLGIVGWGTIDNGLLLYTLYFGWAYMTAMFCLIDRLLKRWPMAKYALAAVMILVMGVYNMNGLREILAFTTQFFPVLG